LEIAAPNAAVCYLTIETNVLAILGISSGATADEIRSAYRRLAKEFHPDHYTGGSERFRDIQEAYSVLGNSRRRRAYEQKIRSLAPTLNLYLI